MITTYSGRFVNPLALRPQDITIEDIAHALACVNRFAGHAREPISVAQHSVYVSRLCPAQALPALLHDASEAYLGDVTKWLKQEPIFAGYQEVEEQAQRSIFERFGCVCRAIEDIECADRLMVRWEYAMGYDGRIIDHPDYPPITATERLRIGPWQPWPWRMAESQFLMRYAEVRRLDLIA